MKNLRISWGFSFELRISLTLSFRCVHHSIAKRMSLIRRLIMCPSARDVPAPPRRGTPWVGSAPPAGQHGARGDTEEIRNGRDALIASDGETDAAGVRLRQARPSRRFVHGVSWVDLAVLLLPLLSFPCGVLLRVVGAGQLFEDFPRGQQSLPRRWNCSASRW